MILLLALLLLLDLLLILKFFVFILLLFFDGVWCIGYVVVFVMILLLELLDFEGEKK